MDYGKAIKATFEDENWISVILIGGALGLVSLFFFWTLIIPILVGAVLLGYMMQIIRDVRLNPDAPLPEWTGWGKKLSDGFKLMIVELIWAIPVLLFLMPVIFLITLAAIFPDSDFLAILSGLSVIVMTVLAIAYGILLVFLQPAIVINLAVKENFSAGIDFHTIFGITRKHFVDILIILVLVYGLSYIASWVGMLLFMIGVLFTGFWVLLVKGHLFGQLARLVLPPEDDVTSLTPVENKSVSVTQ